MMDLGIGASIQEGMAWALFWIALISFLVLVALAMVLPAKPRR